MYGIGQGFLKEIPKKRDRYEIKYREAELEFAFMTGKLEGDDFKSFEDFFEYRYGSGKREKSKKDSTVVSICLFYGVCAGVLLGIFICRVIAP